MVHAKAGELATIVTVTLMCPVALFVLPWLAERSTTYAALGYLGTVLISSRLYRSIAQWLLNLAQTSLRIRKYALGRNFLEGTWFGRIEREGEKFLTVEYFSQASGSLAITGQMFHANGDLYANWESKAAQLDAGGAKLHYSYECRITSQGGTKHLGLAEFALNRPKFSKPPTSLTGEATDLIDVLPDFNIEYKSGEHQLPAGTEYEQAKKYFEKKKESAKN